MNPDDYCRQKAAPLGSGLHYCTLFLDPQRRQAVIALHAFKREIGDLVQNVQESSPARAKLGWWRMEICSLFAQQPTHPVTRALAETLRLFPFPQEQLLEVIDGYEMDIDQGRYDDFKALRLYCYRISSTISTVTAEILGYNDRQTAKFAHELGLALHLANIIRNVGLDARQGRIYLPLDEMQKYGVTETGILDAPRGVDMSPQLQSLLRFQVQRVRELLANAYSQLANGDRNSQRSLLAMATLELALLDEVERDGYRVLDRSLSLTPIRKLWLVTRTWLNL